MATSEEDMSKERVTARLIELISNMSLTAQKLLLTRLEEKLGMYKRKHPRKPYFSEVDFASDGEAYTEFIQDISAGGLFIETRSPLPIGQEITLLLPFPDHDRPIKIIGEVVRATDKGMGVKFKHPSPVVEDVIADLVEKI